MEPKSLFTIFALQLARIQDKLNPHLSHVSGPRRPDLQETERVIMKKGSRGGDN